MKLFMLRHGETDWNKAHRFQGQIDIPLNDWGRELAQITANKWPIIDYDRVYCSPLIRAQETAHIVLNGRPELDHIITDPRITEFGFGPCEGKIIDEESQNPDSPMYNMLHHPELYVPVEGAESFQDLVNRAHDFLTDEILPLEGKCENVLIVAHGALIRALVCAAGLKTIAGFWDVRYFNCCLTTLDVTSGSFSMISEAETFYDTTGMFGGFKK